MRVALLSWDFPPCPTGLGRAASTIAAALAGQGVEVTVFTADREGEEVREDGVRIIGVPTGRHDWLRHRAAIGHIAAPLAFGAAVRARHRVEPFDIIEATNWYAPAAALTNLSVPLVVRNSTPAIDAYDPAASWRDRMDLKAAAWLEARTARKADALISNTHPHRERMVREYALSHRRHHVVHLALEDNLLAAGASTSYPAADQPFTMTFVGRAERRKGFDALMAALPLVPADPQAIRLHIIGLSQSTFDLEAQRSGLASHIKDCVIVHGRASDATLHACYRDSHAVVAPSRYESYGLVYREAAAFGRPLIACDADPSAVDFIGRTGCGVLATGCEGRALAAAIAAVRDDPSAALAMRRAGLSHARTLHIERLADATLEVYREAVDHVASRRSRQRCRPAIRRELISAHTIQPR